MGAAATCITYGLVQYATFRIGTYDLVIFDQAVRSHAHLRPGVAPVKGVQDGFGPGFSVLGDHWSPVLALPASRGRPAGGHPGGEGCLAAG